jgi:hypothetical protein
MDTIDVLDEVDVAASPKERFIVDGAKAAILSVCVVCFLRG